MRSFERFHNKFHHILTPSKEWRVMLFVDPSKTAWYERLPIVCVSLSTKPGQLKSDTTDLSLSRNDSSGTEKHSETSSEFRFSLDSPISPRKHTTGVTATPTK